MKNELSEVHHAKERQRFIEFRWELYVPHASETNNECRRQEMV